jgi:signal transduction histidine kinase
MLRILASLGVSLAVFSHEVRGALTGVDSSIELLFEKLEKKSGKADLQEILSQRDELDVSVDRLRDVSHYIADLISHSSSREKGNQALYGVIESFVNQFKNYLNAHGINFETKIDPPFLRTDEMHRSEIDSVLFNFLTNSVKSMDRSKSKDRKIKITAERDGELAVISFQDTGGGVASDIKHRIFDAFFTTSLFKGDEIAGPGSGLGLKIVSDIAEANGGYVRLGEPDPGYFCRFDFAVPLSREQI